MRRDHRWQAIMVTLIIALFSEIPPTPPTMLNQAKRTGSRGVC